MIVFDLGNVKKMIKYLQTYGIEAIVINWNKKISGFWDKGQCSEPGCKITGIFF